MHNWAGDYFERGYTQRWGALPVTDSVRRETSQLWSHFQLSSSARVVDLGCGNGRYALAFAEQGADVVGVDAAVTLLVEAKRRSSELGLPVHWVRGDMRDTPLRPECCDAVVVMDAFGFFESEDDNERVLAEAARVLARGGGLVLKVANGAPILASFRSADREERDGVVVAISRTLTQQPPRMIEHLSITDSGGSGQYERRQRLYRVDELYAGTMRAGFEIVGVFADATGEPFEPTTSSSIWVIGRRSHAV